MIPRLGTSVWESLDGEPGRGGTVIELGEDYATVVELFHGKPRYHLLPYAFIDPDLGDGEYRNRAYLRRLLTYLNQDEVNSRRPLKHDAARRAITHVLEEEGDPLTGRGGR